VGAAAGRTTELRRDDCIGEGTVSLRPRHDREASSVAGSAAAGETGSRRETSMSRYNFAWSARTRLSAGHARNRFEVSLPR
jgi:hypothetical protein